jgi:hypothetical protein
MDAIQMIRNKNFEKERQIFLQCNGKYIVTVEGGRKNDYLVIMDKYIIEIPCKNRGKFV